MVPFLLKSNLRLIRRNKVLSTVKISGLALGSAVFLLTSLFSWHEIQHDIQHPESDRIYRYVHRVNTPEGLQSFAFTSATTGPALKERFPEVQDFCRIFVTNATVRNANADLSFNEKRFSFADANFLTLFDFPLKGNVNLETALKEPYALILTPSMAKKYFADSDPVGQTLSLNGEIEFVVKGVFQSDFARTHLQVDFVASFASLEAIKNHPIVSRQIPASLNLEAKGFNTFYTYLKLTPGTPPAELEAKFPAFIEEFRGAGKSERLKPYLQPLTSIHLHSNLLYEIGQNGSADTVYVYFLIGALVLLIACINYINISTAEFIRRARGIGLKKILGVGRNALVWSHIIETTLLTAMSVTLGSMLAWVFLPVFNEIVGRNIYFMTTETAAIIAGIFVAISFAGGLYPAISISRAQALEAFRGKVTASPAPVGPRHVLVFFQLLISFCLVAISLLIYRQLDYLLKKDPGFAVHQIITFNATAATPQQRAALKERVLSDKSVTNATMCSIPPGEPLLSYGLTLPENDGDAERRIAVYQSFVDSDFISTLGIRVTEGRFFDPSNAADSTKYMIFNQAAAQAMGGSVLGRDLKIPDVFSGKQISKAVLGVTENFSFASFHQEIQPLVLEYNPDRCRYLLIRFPGAHASRTLMSVEKAWKQILPLVPFDYYFLDEDFAKFYDKEQSQKKVISCMAFLAIALAALGIFGTTLFLVQQRTKEMGIRKILGSGQLGLLWLLMKPLAILVVIASVVGVPVSLAAGHSWLEKYPYHIDFSPAILLIALATVVLVIAVTILERFVRVSNVNPAEVLRHER